MLATPERDTAIRFEAVEHVKRLSQSHRHLTTEHLAAGFQFEGGRVPLINPQRGIFKPQQMRWLLSIRTVFPRHGARIWYDDQRKVHAQIYAGDETVDYAFQGTNPEDYDNRWLRDAYECRIPIIYFLGVAPGRYQAIIPTFVADWDAGSLKARISFGLEDQPVTALPESAPERRYALRQVKQRLHQDAFREALISAYGGRCALSGLPEPLLIDAAHIIEDKDERLGQPIVPNGLPLSKIHHAAFDAHLIGVDPDFGVHVARRLLAQRDGPMLEALKQLEGRELISPRRREDLPDRKRLEMRFEKFRRLDQVGQ